MMMEEDEDARHGDESDQVTIEASVFEAYSRQISVDREAQRAPTMVASADIGKSATGKRKEKMGLKFKKYLASKLSETSTGQGIIQQYISPRGQLMLKALCSCILKFSGRDIARVMRKYVYKLSSKFGILYSEKVIAAEKLNRAREPCGIFAYHLKRALSDDDKKRGSPVQVQAFKWLLTGAYNALYSLLKNITRQTNTERLRVFYEYLVKGEFLTYFLTSEELVSERQTFLDYLAFEMESVDGDSVTKMYRYRIHQRKRVLSTLLAAPSLQTYLKNAESRNLVIRFMANEGGADVLYRLQFAATIEDYTKLTSRSKIASEGLRLFETYFGAKKAGKLPIPAVVIDEISSKVSADVFPLNLYWDAYSAVLQSLEGLFMQFLSSDEFRILSFEMTKVEKTLQVLADLTGISEEEFVELMTTDPDLQRPRKQSIFSDDDLTFSDAIAALQLSAAAESTRGTRSGSLGSCSTSTIGDGSELKGAGIDDSDDNDEDACGIDDDDKWT